MLVADLLQPNSSAGLLVFENAWATRLRDAVVNAGGRLVDTPASLPPLSTLPSKRPSRRRATGPVEGKTCQE